MPSWYMPYDPVPGFTRKTNKKTPAELIGPNDPTWEPLALREPVYLESWANKAYRWRRARPSDPMEHVPGIYALDLAHFTGALIEEVLELKSRVEEFEKQKAPSNTEEGQS